MGGVGGMDQACHPIRAYCFGERPGPGLSGGGVSTGVCVDSRLHCNFSRRPYFEITLSCVEGILS